jgi:heme-degrading monooxygenase HmoA
MGLTTEEADMHARITWGRVKPGHWEAYEAAYRRDLVAAAPPEGLRGRLLVRDTDDRDSGGTVSLWETEADLRAYETGELRARVLPTLQEHFSGEFHTHCCEVRHLRLVD